jgi:para-aminobenzoate synthetase component 1
VATERRSSIQIPLDVAPEGLASVIGRWSAPALLESGSGFGAAGRWNILTARPRLVFESNESNWSIETDWHRTEFGTSHPLRRLAGLLSQYELAQPDETPDPDAPPFQGGLIGQFAYDLAPLLERLPRKSPRTTRLPDIRFALYDTAVTVDHATGSVVLLAADLLGEGRPAVEERLAAWKRALETIQPNERDLPHAKARLGRLVSNFSKGDYIATVRRALEYIAAGDVFQVNLSQCFQSSGRFEPLWIYKRLKAQSPAPFAAYLQWGDLAVVSASPEWFYQTRGDRIVTRPIKGTRPRGQTPEDDARLAAELAASPKDRAELTMIVDLERNDLGRVCRYGSIAVVDPLAIESFAQVHHLVATVEGRIRPGAGPIDIVRAMFPGGSVTGAPKIRAMEIIDELEPTRRGIYTGAIGYFSRGGTSAFNIAIRTLVVEGDRVSYQVGGGIVADSDPETEYHETLHKGRGIRAVLEGLQDAAS